MADKQIKGSVLLSALSAVFPTAAAATTTSSSSGLERLKWEAVPPPPADDSTQLLNEIRAGFDALRLPKAGGRGGRAAPVTLGKVARKQLKTALTSLEPQLGSCQLCASLCLCKCVSNACAKASHHLLQNFPAGRIIS